MQFSRERLDTKAKYLFCKNTAYKNNNFPISNFAVYLEQYTLRLTNPTQITKKKLF
jgi:hypothetical protein